jgi:hypothetical protein
MTCSGYVLHENMRGKDYLEDLGVENNEVDVMVHVESG